MVVRERSEEGRQPRQETRPHRLISVAPADEAYAHRTRAQAKALHGPALAGSSQTYPGLRVHWGTGDDVIGQIVQGRPPRKVLAEGSPTLPSEVPRHGYRQVAVPAKSVKEIGLAHPDERSRFHVQRLGRLVGDHAYAPVVHGADRPGLRRAGSDTCTSPPLVTRCPPGRPWRCRAHRL